MLKVICCIVTPTVCEVKERLVAHTPHHIFTRHQHSAAASPEQVHLEKTFNSRNTLCFISIKIVFVVKCCCCDWFLSTCFSCLSTQVNLQERGQWNVSPGFLKTFVLHSLPVPLLTCQTHGSDKASSCVALLFSSVFFFMTIKM